MSKKVIVALASITLMLTALGLTNSADAKQYPCSELLLPYFEVPIVDTGLMTLFSVNNATNRQVQITFRIFSNWGIEILETQTTLEPNAVYPVNLRDWIVNNHLPDRTLTPEEIEHVKAALSGQPSPSDNLFYSSEVAPGLAVGYVTMQALGDPRPKALWGDFFVAEPNTDGVSGESLARTCRSDDDLCDRHIMRFLDGGGFDAGTRFVVWTGESGQASSNPSGAPVQFAQLSAFDEAGSLLGNRTLALIATQSVPFSDLGFSESFGWVTLQNENDAFVYVKYLSQSFDSLSYSAFCSEEPPPEEGHIDIEKMTNGEDADFPPGPSLEAGSPVHWTYHVTNSGNLSLMDIRVIDNDTALEVICPTDTLEPGESMTCNAEGIAEPCQYMNLGTVVGVAPDGSIVEDTDPSHYFGESGIAIDIEKATEEDDADLAPGPVLNVGDPVTWTYEVTNTGTVPLTNVMVNDDQGVWVDCPSIELAPGESMICTGIGIVEEGQYMNLGTAVGTGPCGTNVSDEDPSHYLGEEPATELPAIDIEKSTNGEDADLPLGPILPSGSPVDWTYLVTNTGNVPLTDVTVSDDQGVAVTCPKTDLAPGDSMACTAHGVAEAGQYGNVGTAAGTSPSGAQVTDADPSHYFGEVLGEQGCSHGYWKNHTESWPSDLYSPDQTVTSVFNQAAVYPGLASATLLDALKLKKGKGSEGGAGILLKQAIAAVLNAAHPEVGYPELGSEVIEDTNAALASGDRDLMISLAEALDLDNNLGCPLN